MDLASADTCWFSYAGNILDEDVAVADRGYHSKFYRGTLADYYILHIVDNVPRTLTESFIIHIPNCKFF